MPPAIDENCFYRQPNPKRLNSSSTFESEVASKNGDPILPILLKTSSDDTRMPSLKKVRKRNPSKSTMLASEALLSLKNSGLISSEGMKEIISVTSKLPSSLSNIGMVFSSTDFESNFEKTDQIEVLEEPKTDQNGQKCLLPPINRDFSKRRKTGYQAKIDQLKAKSGDFKDCKDFNNFKDQFPMRICIPKKKLLDSKVKSGNSNSGYSNSGDSNSEDSNSGDSNSGESNSGESNSRNSNYGEIEIKTPYLAIIECIICKKLPKHDISKPDTYGCLNGHVLCQNCVEVFQKCPECSEEPKLCTPLVDYYFSNPQKSNTNLPNLQKSNTNLPNLQKSNAYLPNLQKSNVQCKFELCKAEMDKEKLKDHEPFCIHREVSCPAIGIADCTWNGPLSKFMQHLKENRCMQVVQSNAYLPNLQKSNVQCKFELCKAEMDKEKLKDHEPFCIHREVSCPAKGMGACTWNGPLSEFMQHLKENRCMQVVFNDSWNSKHPKKISANQKVTCNFKSNCIDFSSTDKSVFKRSDGNTSWKPILLLSKTMLNFWCYVLIQRNLQGIWTLSAYSMLPKEITDQVKVKITIGDPKAGRSFNFSGKLNSFETSFEQSVAEGNVLHLIDAQIKPFQQDFLQELTLFNYTIELESEAKLISKINLKCRKVSTNVSEKKVEVQNLPKLISNPDTTRLPGKFNVNWNWKVNIDQQNLPKLISKPDTPRLPAKFNVNWNWKVNVDQIED